MAKSYFSCANCGKDVTVAGRNRADADRRAKWSEKSGSVCGDCYRKQRAEKNAREAAEAAQVAADAGLPAVIGVSEKQVAYGEAMRARAIDARLKAAQETLDAHKSVMTKWLSPIDAEIAIAEFFDAIAACCFDMDRNTSAKFWIEDTPRDYREWFLRKIMDEGRAPISRAVYMTKGAD